MNYGIRTGSLTRKLLLVLLALFTGALAAADRLTESPMQIAGAWHYARDVQDKLWLLYYDEDRVLRLRDPDGEEHPITPEHAGQAPSGLALAPLDSGVGALWRTKLPTKGLYLVRGGHPVSSAMEVGGGSEPSMRIDAKRNADHLDLLWVGERPVEGSDANYHLYYRQMSLPDGKLSVIEHVLPGIYPVWATNDRGALMAFSWVADGSTGHIKARARAAGADGFGQTVTVAEVPGITPVFRAFHSGQRWFALWLAQYTSRAKDLLLEGAFSEDDGATWQRFSFDELRGYDVASLDVAADEQGHILIAMATRNRDRVTDTKQDVVVVRSSDWGVTWSPAVSLRPEGLRERFRAINPAVIFGKVPGQVLVVWEDWREIRSRLYASLSADYGASWSYANVPLPHPPRANMGLRYGGEGLYLQANSFNVIAEQAVDDRLSQKHLVHLSFTAEDLGDWARRERASRGGPEASADDSPESANHAGASVEQEQTEAALRKRTEGFWQAMVDEEYASAYAFYDPFFRARNDVQRFEANMGRIHYAGFAIEDIRIEGPKAEITTKVRFSVGPFRMPKTGEEISRPEREVAVTENWLWVDDAWYREFRSESQDFVYTKY